MQTYKRPVQRPAAPTSAAPPSRGGAGGGGTVQPHVHIALDDPFHRTGTWPRALQEPAPLAGRQASWWASAAGVQLGADALLALAAAWMATHKPAACLTHLTASFPEWEPPDKHAPCGPQNPCLSLPASRTLAQPPCAAVVAAVLAWAVMCDLLATQVAPGRKRALRAALDLPGTLLAPLCALLLGETDVFFLGAVFGLGCCGVAAASEADYIAGLHLQLKEYALADKWAAHIAGLITWGIGWALVAAKGALASGESTHFPHAAGALACWQVLTWSAGAALRTADTARGARGPFSEAAQRATGLAGRAAVVSYVFLVH